MKSLDEIINNRQFKPLTVMNEDDIIRVDGYFFDPVTQKRWLVIFTASLGWEHASVSQPNKTPTWDVMCRIKDIFWSEDECCVEYHPKKEDYVNMHEHCLHIWKPMFEELPTPPAIMVGFKDVDSETTAAISKAYLNSLTDDELMEMAEKRGHKLGNRSIKRRMAK